MKKTIATLFSLLIATTSALSQTGSWRNYMSYYEPQQIVKAGHLLYVRASNGLYSYNTNDQSITTFDKQGGLSDSGISHIGWNTAVQKLLIVYANQNIDLMETNGDVSNISAFYMKAMMGDKTVNGIVMDDIYAYLLTGFGVVKLNMARKEIAESYILNRSIAALGVSNGTIFLQTKDDAGATLYLKGQQSTNLIDPHNWVSVAAADLPAGIFTADTADWDNNIALVTTLNPGGPRYNNFGFVRLKNKKLYTCGGGWDSVNDLQRPATVQIMDISDRNSYEWEILPDDMTGVEGTSSNNWKFIDMMVVDVDPLDDKHIIATGRTGMYEYYDGNFVKYHNKDNSLLKNSVNSSSNKYVLVLASLFDKTGSFWCVVSDTRGDNLVTFKDGEWTSFSSDVLCAGGVSYTKFVSLVQDSRGYLWFANSHWVNPSVFCYDPSTRTFLNVFKELSNQDGITVTNFLPTNISEDINGDMWLATNVGLYIIGKDMIGRSDATMTQIKVPRNDGSNYADYLFNEIPLRCIVHDGGGRKWIATQTQGLYLVSADNMEQLEHFTAENSPLLSNVIESMAIDNATGELFVGTNAGLCSYMTDAVEAASSMETDNVYAYPNPVVSDYNGVITVVGLSLNADVKILTTDGRLVVQGRSNGGMFTWDGRDGRGRRVASGIYMVATATSDGKKGVVCKIAVVN